MTPDEILRARTAILVELIRKASLAGASDVDTVISDARRYATFVVEGLPQKRGPGRPPKGAEVDNP